MSEPVSTQDLMRYLDGELPPDERHRVENALSASTELQRELAIFRQLKTNVQALTLPEPLAGRSIWDRLARRLVRPAGWWLLSTGLVAWLGYGIWLFTATPGDPWRKLTVAAVAIGILLLFASVIWERYREWVNDPYRNVQR